MASADGSFLFRQDLGFLSERGIIQGGTEKDIILCVVNGPDGDAIREAISSAATQQVIADRMSAFCCFAGMEIATNNTEYVAIKGVRAPRSPLFPVSTEGQSQVSRDILPCPMR
jgi:hypothetical protein